MQYKLLSEEYIHGGIQKDHYNESDVISCNCPLCGSVEKIEIYRERDNLGIAECCICKLIYTNPRAIESEKNYFGEKNLLYDEARLIFKEKLSHHRDKNYEYELKSIMKFKSSGKLLDIGTSMGFFLRKAKQVGFDVYGVEPSPASAQIAIEQFNLNIVNDFFKASLFSPKSFDIVTLIDVF